MLRRGAYASSSHLMQLRKVWQEAGGVSCTPCLGELVAMSQRIEKHSIESSCIPDHTGAVTAAPPWGANCRGAAD